MVRIKIYLTEEGRKVLSQIAKETNQSQNEIIRQAINRFIER